MNKQREIIMKGRPIIQNNGHGSAVYIDQQGGHMVVEQVNIVNRNGIPMEEVYSANVNIPVEIIIDGGFKPGDPMAGEVRQYIRMSPPDPDDPTINLSWLPDGTVERIDGKTVWRWTEYVESEHEYE